MVLLLIFYCNSYLESLCEVLKNLLFHQTSILVPEGWEYCSKNGFKDQSQYKIVAEDPVMDKANRGEPARPDRVAYRRFGWSRFWHALDGDLCRFDRDKDQEHDRCEEMGYEDQVKHDHVWEDDRPHRDISRCWFADQHRQGSYTFDSVLFEFVGVFTQVDGDDI